MEKIIVVVGVTGAQGGSVARTFLHIPGWDVRGITRKPEGEVARSLAEEGVQIIKADLGDVETLIQAFQGAHVIFSNTDFFQHLFFGLNPANLPHDQNALEYAYAQEVSQGVNIAQAAADPSVTKTLERFVMSSLSDASERSNGKFTKVYHFDSKAETIRRTRELYPRVAAKMSTVTIGHYASIWKYYPGLAPQLQPDGSFLLRRDSPPEFKWPFIDTERDTGGFVKALVDLPPDNHLLAVSEHMTLPEWMRVWGRVHGVKAGYQRITRKELFTGIPGPAADEMGDTFDYIHEFGYTGGDPTILEAEEIGLAVLTTSMEENIKREDWSSIIASSG